MRKIVPKLLLKDSMPRYGYHNKLIKKGIYGELSKIREELEELEDAMKQENRVMALCELSDMFGAIREFLQRNFPDFHMRDLHNMAKATKSAFKKGYRK